MVLEDGKILVNEEVTSGVWYMEVEAPMCAETAQPGQFVHIKLPDNLSGILRLPFSMYGADADNGSIEILYQVLGGGTRFMTTLSVGETVGIMGPIGHGWEIPDGEVHALVVTGGLGAAPMAMLAKELRARHAKVDFCMGAPTSARLVGRERLAKCGTVSVATDDGSEGLHGFSTDLAERMLDAFDYDIVYTCGPEPMQRIVVRECVKRGIPSQVSMERLMACGVGACLSCVVETVDGRKRACVDGPVFKGEEVVW